MAANTTNKTAAVIATMFGRLDLAALVTGCKLSTVSYPTRGPSNNTALFGEAEVLQQSTGKSITIEGRGGLVEFLHLLAVRFFSLFCDLL